MFAFAFAVVALGLGLVPIYIYKSVSRTDIVRLLTRPQRVHTIPSRNYSSGDLRNWSALAFRWCRGRDLVALTREYISIDDASVDFRTRLVTEWVLDGIYFRRFGKSVRPEALPWLMRERAQWEKERSSLGLDGFSVPAASEPFFYAHGLHFASEGVRAYVRDRDLLDIGGYRRESLIGLSPYTMKRVITYELMEDTARRCRAVSEKYNAGQRWRGTAASTLVVRAGVSNKNGTSTTGGKGRIDAALGRGDETVPTVTIDDEAARLNLTVGFIKADVEGHALEVLQGAVNTIKRDRPVISIAVYHGREVATVPKFLKELGIYRLELRTETVKEWAWRSLGDLRIFAIPFGVD